MITKRVEQRQHSLRLGLIAGIVQFVILAFVQFLSIKIVMEYLGKEGYGAWSLLTLVIYWSTLFDLGLSKGLLNILSEANGQEDRNKAVNATSTTLAVLGIIASIGVFLVWIITIFWGMDIIVFFKLQQVGVQPWILGVVGTLFFINMPLSVFTQIFWAYQLRHVAVMFLVFSSLLTLLSQIVCVSMHLGLNVMVFLFIAPTTLGLLLSGLYLFYFKMKWIRPKLSSVKLSSIKGMKRTSLGYFCFGLTAFLINELQPSILARISSLSVTAEWQIISRIILSLSAPIQMSTFAFVPALRESSANGDLVWMRKAFIKMVAIRMSAAALGVTLLFLIGPFLLTLLVKRSQVSFDATIWYILVITVIIFTWNSCFTDLFSIMDKIWFVVWATVLNALVVVGLTIFLVPKIGISGALFSYVAMPLLLFSWVMPLIARRVFFRRGIDEA